MASHEFWLLPLSAGTWISKSCQIRWSHTSSPMGGGYSHLLHIAIGQPNCWQQCRLDFDMCSNQIVRLIVFIFDVSHLLHEMHPQYSIYPDIFKNSILHWNGEGITILLQVQERLGVPKITLVILPSRNWLTMFATWITYQQLMIYMVILLNGLRITLNQCRISTSRIHLCLYHLPWKHLCPILINNNGHLLLSSKYDCAVL